MKLFKWIFDKKKETIKQEPWTLETHGWEASMKAYNKAHNLPENMI